MRAKFSVEPSDNNGVAAWVRAIDAGDPTYWKWYQTESDAFEDANHMGLGTIEMIASSESQVAILARRSVPIEITIDPGLLIFWGFDRRDD
jgi:hypothetical protein